MSVIPTAYGIYPLMGGVWIPDLYPIEPNSVEIDMTAIDHYDLAMHHLGVYMHFLNEELKKRNETIRIT